MTQTRSKQTAHAEEQSCTPLKPTIAHFMPWAGVGGVEIATQRMTAATAGEFRNVAFCLPEAHDVRALFQNQGTETATYTAPVPSFRHFASFYRRSKAVAKELKKFHVKVVHFSDAKAAYENGLAAWLAGARTVCHFRVTYPKLTWREKLYLLPVEKFIFVSKDVMRTFGMRVPKHNARVIYDSVDFSSQDSDEMELENSQFIRREFKIPTNARVIGMVARVNPQKDYFTLAKAAAKVLQRYPDTKFLIVGDNANVENNRIHFDQVMLHLQELGIAESFIFTGHRTDVARLISGMDVCILVTHREGFPLCLLEALALRRPVVATAVDGIPELVIHEQTGLLHRHGDADELADGILHLIENPEKAKKLGLAGQAHVQANFSRKAFIHDLTMTYLDAMQDAR